MAIVHSSIQSQLYDELKSDILRKKYKMGEQLNARILAQKYGVSVMPVRDALLQLTKHGLVENRARVGFFITEYNSADISDIMDVRVMHEMYCLDTFFEQIDKVELKKVHETMLQNYQVNKKQFDLYDMRFHNTLVEASSNRFLNEEYDNIKDLLTLSVCYDDQHEREACEEHGAILQAVLSNDKPRAMELLDLHLKRVYTEISSNLQKEMA